MKKILFLLAAAFPLAVTAQNVGIGTSAPAPSALLEVQATDKGVLVPRLTTEQINAITTPANGLLLYNTDSAAFAYRTDNGWLYLKGTATTGIISWGIMGNDGINAATHFIGTNNDMDLVFKRGGVRAGIINNDLLNTSWGLGALNPATTGKENTAIGFGALRDNSNGSENTATGINALLKNTEGHQNTAYGSGSLIYNTTGFRNAALSTYALFNNTAGYDNTATGYSALLANQTGAGNTAIGSSALLQTKGSNNTGIGYFAGADNVDGSFNVFLGNGAGRYEQGSNKLYISNSSTDKNNTLIYGEFDNKLLSIGGKVGIGRQPAFFPLEIQGLGTSNDLLQFTNNAGAGKWHLNLKENGSLNFAESGVADNRLVLGAGGGIGIGMVSDSSFPLQLKGRTNKNNILRLFNEAGAPKWYLTLEGNNLNFYETGVAERRLRLGAGGQVTVGEPYGNSTAALRVPSLHSSDQIGIGAWVIKDESYSNYGKLSFSYNGNVTSETDESGTWYQLSDRRLKKDITAYPIVLDKLMRIEPYNYHYIHNDSNAKLSSGFMAQDVQKLFPDAVSTILNKDGEAMLGINYQYFTVAAIKGIQEQQQKISDQQQKISDQEQRIQRLETALDKLLPTSK